MAVFAAIASLLLSQISQSRQETDRLLQRRKSYGLLSMAMQTGQENLTVNRHHSPPDRWPTSTTAQPPRGEGVSVLKTLHQLLRLLETQSSLLVFEWWYVSLSVDDQASAFELWHQQENKQQEWLYLLIIIRAANLTGRNDKIYVKQDGNI